MTDKDKTVTGMIAAEDRQGLLNYGLSAQAALSEFSGDLLDQMRKAKTGEVETPLVRLMAIVQSADISGKTGKKSDRQMKKALLHYGKTDREVFHIEMTLDALRSELLRDIVPAE